MDLSLDFTPGSPTYGDLVLQNGDCVATSDADQAGTHNVLQNIQQALRSYQGEWFLSLSEGLPYFQTIFAKGTTRAERESIFREAILAVPGVSKLTAFSITQDNATRTLSINFRAQTVKGAVSGNVAVEYSGGVRQ